MKNSKNCKAHKVLPKLKEANQSYKFPTFHSTEEDCYEAMTITSQRDSDLPIDFQTGGENKEELNDNDIMFFMLLFSTTELHSPDDDKIRCSNSSISRIIQNRFTPIFIRKSLGKLHRERLIQLQFKRDPINRIFWREISIISEGLQNDIIQDWIYINSKKMEKSYVMEDLPNDIQVDIDNTEPLTDDDYYIFALILGIEDQRKDNAIRYSNSTLSKLSNSHFSDTTIYQSLGKFAREGLVQMDIYRVHQLPQLWREILVVPGFGSHKGFANWIYKIQKKTA